MSTLIFHIITQRLLTVKSEKKKKKSQNKQELTNKVIKEA